MSENVNKLPKCEESSHRGGNRDSNLELFRIISMLVIVAHHYVVNSGLIGEVTAGSAMGWNDAFILLFGWGGKTAINGFVLITGYFMCTSKITVKKFCKLLFEIEFYKILIYFVFLFTGVQSFKLTTFVKSILPIKGISDSFVSCYLVFFLLIPFLNILIQNMTQKQHGYLVLLLVGVFSIFASCLFFNVVFNYVGWFCILYIIASYVRLYPNVLPTTAKFWGISAIVALALSWISVLALNFIGKSYYYFVSDSNKILALATGFAAFMFFKTVKIKQSKLINTISSATFGVLLIHANSDAMRQWLWVDTLHNTEFYNNGIMVVVHAVLSVLGVYVVCTAIDLLRIKFIEKPFFNKFFKK